ncbi:rod shape-determining protein MreC [Ideonella livida]|uniref:Cell shape-determining protein MreC n=1 Tax=Ideonella livida TaxID=2707176 RepID=A0A7C9PG26_9BURK|nr:rod shape-determining protein MreC [Ideonella livida]NDY91037.1 rod shape-determining protein MreC [Ideonella livida]
MPLGTLDRSPPPLFRQGLSAVGKLGLYSTLALFLMVADHRLGVTTPLRNALATAMTPLTRVLGLPLAGAQEAHAYFGGLEAARQREVDAAAREARLAERAARADQLALENQQLRTLLQLRPTLKVRSLAAEVLYEASDPFSRKVVIDRGSDNGVQPGSPVITAEGIVGQVTRVYLLTSEVTLLVDRDAAIPVLNARTGHRGVAFGGQDGGLLELRFVAANDDVKAGDLLTTSGVDGIYPAGLPVATVRTVDRRGDAGFARISLTPAARPDTVRHALVLEPVGLQLPPRPLPQAAAASAPAGKKGRAK